MRSNTTSGLEYCQPVFGPHRGVSDDKFGNGGDQFISAAVGHDGITSELMEMIPSCCCRFGKTLDRILWSSEPTGTTEPPLDMTTEWRYMASCRFDGTPSVPVLTMTDIQALGACTRRVQEDGMRFSSSFDGEGTWVSDRTGTECERRVS